MRPPTVGLPGSRWEYLGGGSYPQPSSFLVSNHASHRKKISCASFEVCKVYYALYILSATNMARQKVPGVKNTRLQQLSDARTSRLEKVKRRKLDQTPPNNNYGNSVTQVIATMTLSMIVRTVRTMSVRISVREREVKKDGNLMMKNPSHRHHYHL